MVSHSRLSPGIEYNEIDRSQYNTTENYSIVGTTVLINGFSDKGENYTTKWINSKKTFENLYGYPTNEPERYLYNGVLEILNRGGICLVSKLPYDNDSLGKFPAVTYYLDANNYINDPDDKIIQNLSSVDAALTSYAQIKIYDEKPTKLVDLDYLDNCKITNSIYNGKNNTIDIIDITNHKYGKANLTVGKCSVDTDVECLGIMPVIVSPVNALFYQNIISSDISADRNNVQISYHHYKDQRNQDQYTFLSDYTPVTNAANRVDILTNYKKVNFCEYETDNFSILLSSDSKEDETVSRTASNVFPTITYLSENTIDKRYMKYIGVVVFEITKDTSNDSRILFTPVESYVGSLDKNSKNPTNSSSDYIGNIINANSQYINFFSNIKINKIYSDIQTFAVLQQNAYILGFAETECKKNITLLNSIYNPLTRILDKLQDPNQVNIDIVVDAGVSTIAQYVKDIDPVTDSAYFQTYANKYYNADVFPFKPSEDNTSEPWIFNGTKPSAWLSIIKKYDEFCRNVRKDCIFLADGFRPIFIQGNEKIVRNTNITNTIEKAILPNMKYLICVNSSYSAGYCNWFYIIDDYSGDFFWCPPSIKAAGVYVYTDAYGHTWDAPAGLTRGVINSAYDVSFNPRNDEAGKIYQQAWNYAINYPVDGIAIEGQKTFQIQQTALDRINVRRLMLYIEKNIVRIARRFLYEGNTAYLRQRFSDMIKSVLDEVKTGNGISDYAVRCDDTLNTVEVIENNELRAIIAVKPIKTVEYIKLSFICTNQSANVQEEVLKN